MTSAGRAYRAEIWAALTAAEAYTADLEARLVEVDRQLVDAVVQLQEADRELGVSKRLIGQATLDVEAARRGEMEQFTRAEQLAQVLEYERRARVERKRPRTRKPARRL